MKFSGLNKHIIRKKILELRKNLPTYDVLKKSNEIIKKLEEIEEFKEAKKIACYISFGNEVYTHGFIKKYVETKIISVPVVNKKEIFLSNIKSWSELQQGAYGILEPKKEFLRICNNVDLIIVPGIAFDKKGNRIGYGEGYYDKLLKKLNAIKIALAYDFQLLDKIPSEKHDVKIDIIITEKRILRIKK